jgi:hypothetical protein
MTALTPTTEVAMTDAALWRALAELEQRCPAFVPVARWNEATADGRCFLAEWGVRADELGWTADDLFGLAPVPKHATSSFARASRYDQIGLVWLLEKLLVHIPGKGTTWVTRTVVALTKTEARIHTSAGATTVYRRTQQRDFATAKAMPAGRSAPAS